MLFIIDKYIMMMTPKNIEMTGIRAGASINVK